MEEDKEKYFLNITEGDRSVFHAWINEEQKTFIKKCFGQLRTYRHDPFTDEIIDAVCFYCNISAGSLYERSRQADIVLGRYLCFYFFVKKLDYGLTKAGKFFNKNHATVLWGVRKIEAHHTNDVIKIENILQQK
jgi:chromosomal replication initiation ATPase DnaA